MTASKKYEKLNFFKLKMGENWDKCCVFDSLREDPVQAKLFTKW